MKSWSLVSLLSLLAASGPARADTLGANPQDAGRVTGVTKGVKEIDLGGIFVLGHTATEGASTTQISTLGNVGFQYFVKDNLSLGGAALISYDRQSAETYSTSFGGMVLAALHVRLGLGAFLRPTSGVGVLGGTQKSEVTPGMLRSATEVSFLTRLAIPFAFFAGSRVVLQAGPELDVSVGVVTPEGGEGTTVTKITGGFGVSAGYVF